MIVQKYDSYNESYKIYNDDNYNYNNFNDMECLPFFLKKLK